MWHVRIRCSTAAQLLLAVLAAQACVSWPIIGDSEGGTLKRRGLKQSASDRGGIHCCSAGRYEKTTLKYCPDSITVTFYFLLTCASSVVFPSCVSVLPHPSPNTPTPANTHTHLWQISTPLSPVSLHLHLIFKPLLFPPSLLVYQSCISSVSCAPVPVPQSLCAPCVPRFDLFPVVFFLVCPQFSYCYGIFLCLPFYWSHWIFGFLGFWTVIKAYLMWYNLSVRVSCVLVLSVLLWRIALDSLWHFSKSHQPVQDKQAFYRQELAKSQHGFLTATNLSVSKNFSQTPYLTLTSKGAHLYMYIFTPVCACVRAKMNILLGREVGRSLPMQAASREEVIDG